MKRYDLLLLYVKQVYHKRSLQLNISIGKPIHYDDIDALTSLSRPKH